MLSHRITNIDRATRDGSRGSMEGGTRVGGLEHIPGRVDEVPHPQAVVGAMNHVTSLEPKRTVWITRGVRAPKVITYQTTRGIC